MNNKGQGLIEALIALGAAVVIISAITVAVVTAVHNSDFAKYQNLAAGFAQQGIETVKQQSQLNWNDTATYGGVLPFCLSQGAAVLPPFPSTSCSSINAGNMFIRQVNIDKISPSSNCAFDSPCCVPGVSVECTKPGNEKLCPSRVTVTVKWTDGKCSSSSPFCHSVKLDSCIQDIYRIQ